MHPEPTITSPDNPRIKEIARLREQRSRRRTGLFIAEGHREVTRAAQAGLIVREVCACEAMLPDARNLTPTGAIFTGVSERVIAKLAYRQNPEGIIAVVEQPRRRLEDLDLASPPGHPLVLVAVGVAKPGNLGAMARSADAAGCAAMLLADGVVDPFNPNAIRASTCAVFSLPIVALSTPQAIDWLGGRGFKIIAADPARGTSHTTLDLTGPVALVIGAEDTGLDPAWLNRAQTLARIHMRSHLVDSLNASISAAVLLFEADRQRHPPEADPLASPSDA